VIGAVARTVCRVLTADRAESKAFIREMEYVAAKED
jgi:hypothetical protein